MSISQVPPFLRRVSLALACLVPCLLPSAAWGQSATTVGQSAAAPPILFKVRAASERLEMVIHSSRLLTLEMKIPRAQVSNPDLLDLTPISANQLQIYAKKTGVTQVNIWDEQGEIHAIDVVISGDPRELAMTLQALFPTSSIKVFPTATGVALNGYVDRADQVSRITRVAEDYYPKVINNITVGGAQQVVLHVKVMEISRSKLRTLGIDWAQFSSGDFVTSTVGGVITKGTTTAALTRTASSYTTTGAETVSFGVLHQNASFLSFIQALQQNELVKVLAEPTLVAVSGRPAYFMDGGKVPYPVVSGLGSVNVAFQDFGTQVDFVPIILGNGKVRLEVRPSVSEVDDSLAVTLNGTTVPGFTTRTVDTGVELRMGETLALAGLIQQRVESTRNSIPVLGDLPFVGALFRRMTDTTNEVELLILVRPELAEGISCDQLPATGPGENSEPPSDWNFYINGEIEQPPQPKGAGPGRDGGISQLNQQPGHANGFGAGGSGPGGPAMGPGMADPMMVNPPGTNASTPSAFGPFGPALGAPRSESVPAGTPSVPPGNEFPMPAPAMPSPAIPAPGAAAPPAAAPSLPPAALPAPAVPATAPSPSAQIPPYGGASAAQVSGRPQLFGAAARQPTGAPANPAAGSTAAVPRYVSPPAAIGSYNPPQANNQQSTTKKSDGELPGFIGSSGYDVSN